MRANPLTRCLILACALVTVGSHASAAPSSQRLQQYEQQIATITSQRDTLKQQLAQLQIAMEAAEQTDIPEKLALEKAQADFEKYSELQETNPSPQNHGRLKNAEFKLHLAERKYRKANQQLNRLEERYESIKRQLSQQRQQLTELNEKVAAEKRLAAQSQQQRQAAALRKAEAEREAAQRELARLKREMAQTNNSSSTSAAPAPAAKPKAAAKAAVASSNTAQPLELDDNFFLLRSAELVASEKQRLEQKLSGRGSQLRSNKILNIRHFVDGNEDNKSSHRFKGLGNYQYRAQATLDSGENQLRVSFDRWNIEIAAADGGQEYVFLMDASNRDAPRIVCYPVSLD